MYVVSRHCIGLCIVATTTQIHVTGYNLNLRRYVSSEEQLMPKLIWVINHFNLASGAFSLKHQVAIEHFYGI